MAPAPAEIQMLGKFTTDPAEIVLPVAEASVVLIVMGVVPLKLRPVEVALVKTVPVEAKAKVPGPSISLVFEFDVENNPVVKVCAVYPES